MDLFFVLSGFLITSLLLQERKRFGKYSLKNFWIRRALRIWPLYYLALVMGFWIIPFLYSFFFGANFSGPAYDYQIAHDPPYYALFLGNWVVAYQSYGLFSNISHLWTISLEEQFYFGWPIILLFIRNFKQTCLVGSTIILFSLLIRFYLGYQQIPHPGIYTNTFARIDILTLGGLLALVYFYKPGLIVKAKFLFRTFFLILVVFLLFYLMYRISVFEPKILRNVVFGYLAFGLILVYLTMASLNLNPSFTKFLEYKPFVFLGKISYGLYIWHVLALELAVHISKYLNIYIIHPVIGLILTVFFGIISYYFFEIFFLKFKSRFTAVKSRSL